MSDRVRLTKRTAADQTPYPGNVNQPDRKDPKWEQYHTFEQQTNHELPDMRHEWQDDKRNDIGFGEPEAWGLVPKVPGGESAKQPPTVAAVRTAANKAVRIAVLLLGEKCDDETIEKQARDLMDMSAGAMDRTLGRFAETQKLYAEEKVEEKKDEEKKAAADEKDEEKKAAADEKVEDKKEEKPVAAAKKAVSEAEATPKVDATKEDGKKVDQGTEVKAADKKLPDFIQDKIDKKEDAADKKAADEKSETKKDPTDMDIELQGAMDDSEGEVEVDERLAALFDDKTTEEGTKELASRESSKKAGITKLGGQPKLASASGVSDISNLWESAPDVSEVFK